MGSIDEFWKRHAGPTANEVWQAAIEGRDWRDVRAEKLAAERLAALAEQIAASREGKRMARARGAKAIESVKINATIRRHAELLWNRKPEFRGNELATARLIASDVNAEIGSPPMTSNAIRKRLQAKGN